MEYYRQYKGKISREDRQRPELPFETKAVFFDFDGTLTTTGEFLTTWERLWKQLGFMVNDCAKLHDRFTRKEITHKEWCDLTFKQFLHAGMTERHLLEAAKLISLVPDAIDTLKELHCAGIKLYIVSGSIYTIIQEALGAHVHLFSEIRANMMRFDSTPVQRIAGITGTEYDFEGKAKFIKEKMRESELSPLNILFVGNSVNDIYAGRSGVRTLCVNPHFTNGGDARHWTYCIKEMKSLREILDYVTLPKAGADGRDS